MEKREGGERSCTCKHYIRAYAIDAIRVRVRLNDEIIQLICIFFCISFFICLSFEHLKKWKREQSRVVVTLVIYSTHKYTTQKYYALILKYRSVYLLSKVLSLHLLLQLDNLEGQAFERVILVFVFVVDVTRYTSLLPFVILNSFNALLSLFSFNFRFFSSFF